MNSLNTPRVAQTLERLLTEADNADRELIAHFTAAAENGQLEAKLAEHLAAERADVRGVYRQTVDNFLNVAPAYGRFLYQCARARNARCIVEFGTSMGVSTIYLAAALRDNGGGKLIGTELEPGKVARAQANLEAAGLGDLVEIRVGDACETLADLSGIDEVDFVLLDGAFSLYLPVLKLLEPRLKPGTPILAENAIDFDNDYLAYVRDARNGYLSQPIPVSEGRGNEFSVLTR